jgi:hypothetical protein
MTDLSFIDSNDWLYSEIHNLKNSEIYTEIIEIGIHKIRIEISIDTRYKTAINFNYSGKNYIFILFDTIFKLKQFLSIFLKHYNDEQYGIFGNNTEISITTNIIIKIIKQGIRDIFTCLNNINKVYPRSMIDYSIYYLDKKFGDSYPIYITRLTCNYIYINQFIDHSIQYNLIEFNTL